MARCITTGTGANGVCLLGEAWGAVEAQRQLPFQGPAGARLARMLAQLGQELSDCLVTNVCSFHPPGNRDPTWTERHDWWPSAVETIRASPCRVVVPLGNIALEATLSLDGIQGKRGYVYWSECLQMWTVPTVHPAFLMRGNANWTGAWLHDVGKAFQIAAQGPPAAPSRDLLLDPPLSQARAWVEHWEAAGRPPLAFDIETPGREKDDDEADEVARGYQAAPIYRIGLAWHHTGVTHALSMPWAVGYLACAAQALSTAPVTAVWNRHFDVPRLRAHAVVFTGQVHDVQEMWHVLQPDLPKKLEFAAPILMPGQPYWKDQSVERPAWYNATDAAVTIEGFEVLYGQGVETRWGPS